MTVPEIASPQRRPRLGHLFFLLVMVFVAREVWVRFGPGERAGDTPAVAAEALVFVTLDSLRSDRLALFGGSGVAAPTLDACTARGVACGNLTTTSTGTNAALATLFTGLDPTEHGVTSLHRIGRQRLRGSVTTLAEELQTAGWRTAGLTSRPQLTSTISGLEQGFELFLSPTIPGVALTDEQLLERPELERELAQPARLFLWVHLAGTRSVELPQLDGPVVAAILGHHLESIAATDDNVRAALQRATAEPAAAVGDLEAALGRQRGRPERAALERALYDLRVRALDRALARLLALVERLRPNAKIVLCATQGRTFDEDLEPVQRVPFCALVPGIAPGRLAVLRAEDVAATLAQLAGLGSTSSLGGEGALARLRAPAPSGGGRATLFVRNDEEDYVLLGETTATRPSATIDGFAFTAAEPPRALAGAGLAIELGEDVEGTIEVYARSFATGWMRTRRDRSSIEPGLLELPVARERLRDVSERLGGSLARRLDLETLGDRRALRLSLVGDEELLDSLAVAGWGPWALPRVALDARDPWPTDENDEPLPPTVDIGRVVGRTLGAVVGPEPHWRRGERAELLIGVWPPDEAARFEVRPGPQVFLQAAPGRPNWVLAKGVTPLMVEIEKPPTGQLAFAARVADRNVAIDEMRFLGDQFTKAGRAVVLLPAWLPGLTDTTPTAPPADGPSSGIRLSVWGPGMPPDAWSLCGDAEARFLERLEATE